MLYGCMDLAMWMYGPSYVDVWTMLCGCMDLAMWMYGPCYVDV